MLKDNPKIVNDLKIKMKNLVDCIIAKAATDSEFAMQLEKILLSELPVTEISVNPIKETIKNKKDKKQNFNPVDYLHNHGEIKLRDELNLRTDNELKQVLRVSGSGKTRIPKTVERQKLIEDIVMITTRTLKQGSSFL